MARISIPQGTDQQPVVPSGDYSDGCKIVSCQVRAVPGENADKEEYLDIGVAIPSGNVMVFAHTTPFGRVHTRLTRGSGSKVEAFLAQLGVSASDFDTDDLLGTPVAVEVNLRQFKNQAGEDYQRVEIVNIARLR